MKKILSLSLALILMATLIIPFQVFAQEDKELEAAIQKAKSVLSIKDGYDTFNYNLYKRNNITVFDLSWNDSKYKLGSVNTSIDSNGKIINYYTYKPNNGDKPRTKLPAISKEDGLKIANDFILKVSPSLKGKLKYIENNGPININDANYRFLFIRIENNVPFPGNNTEVSVDNSTGEVQSYYSNWQDDLVFPDTDGIISMDTAKLKFMEKLGLKLSYKLSYDKDVKSPYLVYTNVYGNQSIDAKTGEAINSSGFYYGGDMQKTEAAAGARPAADTSNTVVLTPEEKSAVESASDLISQSKAEEIGRQTLNLSSDYKIESINLYNNGMEKGNFSWSIYFTKDRKENLDNYYASASVTIDAKSGEVLNFYQSVPYDSNKQVQYSKDQALTIAKDFIKSMQPSKYNEAEYTTWNEPTVNPMSDKEQPRQYYFTFTRKSNDAYFMDNGFNITVDTTIGSVVSYSFSWYKDELPAIDKVISLEEAHKILFDTIGLELQYTADYTSAQSSKIMPPNNNDVIPEIKLIYAIKQGMPSNIDALTGGLLDYSGKPYIERSIPEYSDIKGISGENQIKILAQYGISLPGSEFKPGQVITEKEFLYLLLKSTNFYMDIDLDNDSKVEEAIYNYLMNMGIVKEDEKSPTSSVSKENAAKFVIRSLKFDKAADIKGIYSLPFKDSKSIKSSLYGYVALAYGLNIVKDEGGYFKPSANLTRAKAAVIIYNLLNVAQ